MISNRCVRKSLVINCNSIISKNYLRFLVDSNDPGNKKSIAPQCPIFVLYAMKREMGIITRFLYPTYQFII